MVEVVVVVVVQREEVEVEAVGGQLVQVRLLFPLLKKSSVSVIAMMMIKVLTALVLARK